MAQGNDGYRWRQAGWGEVLVCEPLLAVAPHVFTTRRLPLGVEGHDDCEGYRAIARALAIEEPALYQARQVHGADVVIVPAGTDPAGGRPAADVLLTRTPGTAVAVRVADCVPLLLADRRTGAVAAVHAGWRGTCAGAASRAVAAMHDTFDSSPADLVAAIGPSIGPCCYQVGDEVRAAFLGRDGECPGALSWFEPDGDRWRFDLWAANRDQLLAAGIPATAIHVARECTATSLDRYFSFRREGPRAGRMLAAIRAMPR